MSQISPDYEKQLLTQIIFTKFEISVLSRRKRFLLEQLFKQCIENETEPKRKRRTKSHNAEEEERTEKAEADSQNVDVDNLE